MQGAGDSMRFADVHSFKMLPQLVLHFFQERTHVHDVRFAFHRVKNACGATLPCAIMRAHMNIAIIMIGTCAYSTDGAKINNIHHWNCRLGDMCCHNTEVIIFVSTKVQMCAHLTHDASRKTAVAQFVVGNLHGHHDGGGNFVVDPLVVGAARASLDDVHGVPRAALHISAACPCFLFYQPARRECLAIEGPKVTGGRCSGVVAIYWDSNAINKIRTKRREKIKNVAVPSYRKHEQKEN